MGLHSIPGVVDLHVVRGAHARPHDPFDLVIEVPHGATTTADFTAVADRLTSPLPDGLIDFFYVNTDAGAPELAEAIAARLAEGDPARTVGILRCRIPRTFIDCNRRIDFAQTGMTPGLMPWVTTDADRTLLRAAYDRYVAAVDAALTSESALLMLHSYAPREVDVQVDADIVQNLRRAYAPDREPTWPLRPEVDVIGRGVDGASHAPAAVVDTLRAELAARGLTAADSATYPLHPSTLAHDRVLARPGRALCVEVRRDLLADPFTPFAQMAIGAAKLDRLAPAFVAAIRRWWA